MKQKLFSFALISILCVSFFALNSCNPKNGNNPDEPTPSVTQGKGDYIDLGLPSGTKWRDMNESGYYTYDDAVNAFGNKLPTKSQIEELISNCEWVWIGNGCTIVGKNGNSIYMPAMGQISPNGLETHIGENGVYWSSTLSTFKGYEDYPYVLDFSRSQKRLINIDRTMRHTIRLVTK